MLFNSGFERTEGPLLARGWFKLLGAFTDPSAGFDPVEGLGSASDRDPDLKAVLLVELAPIKCRLTPPESAVRRVLRTRVVLA